MSSWTDRVDIVIIGSREVVLILKIRTENSHWPPCFSIFIHIKIVLRFMCYLSTTLLFKSFTDNLTDRQKCIEDCLCLNLSFSLPIAARLLCKRNLKPVNLNYPIHKCQIIMDFDFTTKIRGRGRAWMSIKFEIPLQTVQLKSRRRVSWLISLFFWFLDYC